jgi:chemotaxis signal transduction protein
MCALQAGSLLGPEQHAAVLFSVSGFQFVIEASMVDEIRNMEGLEPVVWTRSVVDLPQVTHVLHRGRRRFFVVDGGVYFQLQQARPARILLLRNADIGILVDGVDRMVEFGAVYRLPRAFGGAERSWYLGVTFLQEKVVPVVNPASFIREEDLMLLREATQLRQIEASSESAKAPRVTDWGLRSGGRT